jgi:hypothetical protein
MKVITHIADRNEILAEELPVTGDQLDAMWGILQGLDPKAVAADPVFQKIKDIKAKLPKGGVKP